MIILKVFYILLAILAVVVHIRGSIKKKTNCEGEGCKYGPVLTLLICAAGFFYTKNVTYALLMLMLVNLLINKVGGKSGRTKVGRKK